VRGSSNGRRRNWPRLLPGSAEAYAFTTLLVVLASLLRWGLGFFTQDLQAFTTFYPAVLFAALWGGAGVGIFAAILGGIVSWWAFLPPYSALLPLTRGDEINLLTFIFSSIVIVWATDHYRRLTKRLQDEEGFRKLAVEELAHRLKNKLATIQAIVSFRLREHPHVRDEITSALTALTATDDLISATQGQGARIGDILSTELAPYDVSRISMDGPDCLLSPKLALTMALLVHELATNAAKYGALSSAAGKLAIDWTLADTRLRLDWRESGGPPVSPPAHSGFGTRLFLRALEPFSGQVDATFAPSGLVCKLSVVLPQDRPSSADDLTGKRHEAFAAD
jgi:two-component sensor histidine kinase